MPPTLQKIPPFHVYLVLGKREFMTQVIFVPNPAALAILVKRGLDKSVTPSPP